MIRNLKVLGLAIGAVLALSAVMASAAMAVPTFTASSYPATATGSNTKGSEVFTTEGGKVECNSHFQGSLSAASTTLTVAPTYTGCEAFGFLEANVNTEGCTYVFHATELVSAGVYRSHVDVVCPAGKSIKIIAGTCRAEIKAQTGLTSAKTTNLASSVTVEPEVAKVAYTVTEDGFLCPFGSTGNKTDGTYSGHVVVSRVGGGSISVSG
jgi:hypothetical protein